MPTHVAADAINDRFPEEFVTTTEQEVRPAELGFEELADQIRPGQPTISPDGTSVAFIVTAASRKGEHSESAIWISRDGQPARRFTGGENADQEVSWSPDGTRLAFLSNRKDQKEQGIYVLPVDGGEAQRLGELEGSLSSLKWSPDGKSLAVIRVDPDTADEKKRKEDKDDPEVFEEELKLARLWVIDAETGKGRTVTAASRNVWAFAWHPDNQSLVYTSTPINTINSIFVESILWHVPARGGLSRQVARFSPAPGSPVVRTVDGEDVVLLAASVLREDPSVSVWSVPLSGGDPVNLLPGYEGIVYSIVPDPASDDRVFVQVVEGTHGRWHSFSASGGDLESVSLRGLDGGTIASEPSVANDGQTVTAIWSKPDAFPEVYLVQPDEDAVALTSFGKSFEGRLSPGETIRWTADDGVEIEGVLIRPRDYDESRKYPLFVQIHGGPGWQWTDGFNMNWHDWGQMIASRGWLVLLPNPRGSTGRGSAFEKLLFGDVGGGESTDLIAGARALVDRGIADPDRLAIGGWSWGGYLTAWTITQTTMFKAAIMGAGVANLVSDHGAGDIAEANMAYYPGHPYTHWDLFADRSPVRHAANVTTPTLILHGGSDQRVHPTQGQEFHRALQVLGVPVRFVRYPREGHRIVERHHQIDLMKRIVEWLEKWAPESKSAP
jgi:dipeptidyl aminopeptidase/acylaminoacyl peptidase